jgi:hypothetical protein
MNPKIMSYDTNFNQAERLEPESKFNLKGASHAEHQSIKATDNNWQHMACCNAVEQPFIEYRDENIGVQ